MGESRVRPIAYKLWRPVFVNLGFLGLEKFRGRGFFDSIDARVQKIQVGPRSWRDSFEKGVSTQFFDDGGRLDFYGLFFRDRGMLGKYALVRLFRDERKVVGVDDPNYDAVRDLAAKHKVGFEISYGFKDWGVNGSYCSDLGEIVGVLNGLMGFYRDVNELYSRE